MKIILTLNEMYETCGLYKDVIAFIPGASELTTSLIEIFADSTSDYLTYSGNMEDLAEAIDELNESNDYVTIVLIADSDYDSNITGIEIDYNEEIMVEVLKAIRKQKGLIGSIISIGMSFYNLISTLATSLNDEIERILEAFSKKKTDAKEEEDMNQRESEMVNALADLEKSKASYAKSHEETAAMVKELNKGETVNNN